MSGRRRPRTQGRRGQPRTLRTRLVVASVALIAVVCAVIGTVTTIALRSHLYDQLNGNVAQMAMRAAGGPLGDLPGGGGSPRPPGDDGIVKDPLDFVTRGQAIGAIGAIVKNGDVTQGVVSVGKKDS
ncbi:two-component sensor histidine kinase, partial [Streptomyces zhihengii]